MTDLKSITNAELQERCSLLASCLADQDPVTIALAVRLQAQRHDAERARRELLEPGRSKGGW